MKRLVPEISEKMLIQQLRKMEADGVVHRKLFHEVSPRVEYSVTEFGAELEELAIWGKKHAARISERRAPKAEQAAAQ